MTSILSWFLGAAPQSANPLDDRYYEVSTGTLSRSGVRVSADTAMRVSAVYRCVSILANVLAMFPKGMYEKLEKGRRPAPDHPLDPIISFAPNKRQTAFEFWRLLCFHLVLCQNAYAQIVQGAPGRGWVGQLVPLHPDRIKGPEELADGRLRYEYTRPNGEKYNLIGGVDIWHLTGLSSDGLKGMSMLDLGSDTFGLSMAAERHASRFFERGVKPGGILQHDRTLKPDTARELSDSFSRLYGGEGGMGKVPVLWEGMKFTPVSMTLKDAEFLDSRKYSVAEIARWFGVPPHMVGDVERSTSWGTGIEQQGLQFLIYSLLPWIELIEQSIRFTFVVESLKYYPKMNVNAILRMDAEAQASVFATLIDKGVLSPNECRELLERNPREGGDEFVDVAKSPTPPPSRFQPQQNPPPPPDGQQEQNQAAAMAAEVAANVARARAEELRDEEVAALARMARQHSKDSEEWRSAVAGFYGRFARRIATTGICSLLKARAWCVARRDLVLSDGGLMKLTTDHPAADGALLALSNGGSSC
jgi:HK97 family phage portal protein